MCDRLSEGGRRCPGSHTTEAHDRHNERRRNNTAARRSIADQARAQIGDDAYHEVMSMTPGAAKRWDDEHLSEQAVSGGSTGASTAPQVEFSGRMSIIADIPMADVVTDLKIRERITSQEFKDLVAANAAARARLDELDALDGADPVAYHDAYDEMRVASRDLAAYRVETANMLRAPELRHVPTPVPDGAFEVGEAESGSKEWLEMRQRTLGGSDVGGICRVGQYGNSDYKKVMEAKTDRNPQDQEHSGLAGAGDSWEPVLLAKAGELMGEEVLISKSTLSNGRSHVNIDGYIAKEDGSIATVMESKTSSHPEDWENGAPDGYVLQTEHYMDFHGAERAVIVANLNDERFVMVEVYPDTKVQPGEGTIKKLKEANGGEGFTYADAKEHCESSVERWNKKRQEPEKPKKRTRYQVTPELAETFEKGMRNGFVSIDLETTTFSARTGHIIDIGMVDEDGNRFESLYGTPEKHIEWNGTGAVEIHQITPEMIHGKPQLLGNEEETARVREFIGDRVILAHNGDTFEKNWLAANGIDAECADSMKLFGAFVDDEDVKDNTLKSLVEWNGDEYANAHRAMPDAEMTLKTLPKLKERIIPKLEKMREGESATDE